MACKMLGGYTVRSEEDAKVFAAKDVLDRHVEVGEELMEEPCEPPHGLAYYREERGQECPRVELDPDNVDAMHLYSTQLNEDAREMGHLLWQEIREELDPDERRAVLMRVTEALSDVELLRLVHKPRKESAGG